MTKMKTYKVTLASHKQALVVEGKSVEEVATTAAQTRARGDHDVMGVETPRGKGYFFKVSHGVAYSVSVSAAALELALYGAKREEDHVGA